jgi:hypothetical protein
MSLYGMMIDFERRWLRDTPEFFMTTMTRSMREYVTRIAPIASKWLAGICYAALDSLRVFCRVPLRRAAFEPRVIVIAFSLRKIVRCLQIEPKARVCPEIAAEPNRCIGGHVAALANNIAQTIARDSGCLAQSPRRKPERLHEFFGENFAWACSRSRHASLLQ